MLQVHERRVSQALGPALEKVGLLWLCDPGATFAGRDVYAPAAAHLCLGVELDDFGAEIDPAGLRPGVVALSRSEGDTVVAQVLWIDRFGNAQLNVEPDQLAALGEPIQIRTVDITRNAAVARSFADLAPGEVGLVTDSYGLVAIVLNQRSAAEELGLAEDAEVVLAAADGADGPGPTPVELSPSRGEDSP